MSLSNAAGPITVLRGHEGDVQCLEWLQGGDREEEWPHGGVLASGDILGNLIVWSVERRRPIHTQR